MPFLPLENLVGAVVRAFACVAGSVSILDAMFEFNFMFLAQEGFSPVFFEKPTLSTHPLLLSSNPIFSFIYIITQVILAFWLVLAYDLLEDRRIDDGSARFKFF